MKRLFKCPAHLVTALWAGAWAQFFISESLKWRQAIAETPLWMALALVFVLLAILPWRWRVPGGVLLISCGIGLLLAYDIWPPREMRVALVVLLELLLALPPLSAGLYFLSPTVEST